MKNTSHTLSKYKRKIKSLSKERESLKKTLQKRNQTIINLNKESSRLKRKITSLQSTESRFNSDVDGDDELEVADDHKQLVDIETNDDEEDEEGNEPQDDPEPVGMDVCLLCVRCL